MSLHKCSNCGHVDEVSEPGRWEPLSSGLVSTFYAFVAAVARKGVNDVHLETEANLTHKQHANFQKLRYHGLVAKPEKGKSDGRWLLTKRGGEFRRNEIWIAKKVFVKDNHVIGYSEEKVRISDFYGKHPEFQTQFEYEVVEGDVLKKIQQPTLL